MVDFNTYRALHEDDRAFQHEYLSIDNTDLIRIGEDAMKVEDPPSGPEIAVFPDKLVAFNLGSKQWGISPKYTMSGIG